MTPASGVGRSHGASRTQPFDRWFRYPAGFAHDYAEMLIAKLGVQEDGLIADPFVGSGATGAACRMANVQSYGVEVHPLIAELAQTKFASSPEEPAQLKDTADDIVDEAKEELTSLGSEPGASETDLVRRSFNEATLCDLLALRTTVKRHLDDPWGLHLKWSLLGTLRDVASVKVGWPYQRPGSKRQARYSDAFARFRYRAGMMSEDLASLPASTPEQIVVCGDAREAASWANTPAQADGCISSPPYMNNFDYADATRLELYFWGDVRTWAEMVASVRSSMVVASTQQSSRTGEAAGLERLRPLGEAADEVAAIHADLASERSSRERGKEYDQVVPDYFAGMADVLVQLHAAMRVGAKAAWLIGDSAPYGVYIDTPGVIGRIASAVGFEVEEDLILRRRGGRWAGNNVRHTEMLSERLLVFRST